MPGDGQVHGSCWAAWWSARGCCCSARSPACATCRPGPRPGARYVPLQPVCDLRFGGKSAPGGRKGVRNDYFSSIKRQISVQIYRLPVLARAGGRREDDPRPGKIRTDCVLRTTVTERRQGVCPGHIGVEVRAGLRYPALGAEVDVHDPETLLVTPAPLEVVEQRPD